MDENVTFVSGIEAHALNFAFNLFIVILSSYIFIALAFYEYSLTYWRENDGATRRNQESKNVGRFLRYLCIFGSKIAVIHSSTELAATLTVSEDMCYSLNITWLVTYALGLLVTYLFLWQRQRWLYSNQPLKHLLKGWVTVLSWSTLVFLLLSAITVFLAGSRMVFFSSCGNKPDQAKHHLYTIILSITLVILTIIGQIQILILFLIPLVSHNRRTRKSFRRRSSVSDVIDDGNNRTLERRTTKRKKPVNGIMQLVKKCVILATICMVIDITAAVMTIFLTKSSGKVLYDLNIAISVICCIVSFKGWKTMLFPFKRTRSNFRSTYQTARVGYSQGDVNTTYISD